MPRGIPNQAKNNPVLKTAGLETQDLPIGRTERAPTATSQVGEPVLVQVADRMPDPEKAAMLQFMEELVTIRPTRGSDDREMVFDFTVNNRIEIFKVGEEKTVARKYVDRMLHCKVTTYGQQEVFNSEGIKQIVNVPRTRLRYDFTMVRDDNPQGASWLKASLAMAG